MSIQDEALIAQIGRTVGLWGDLKFHLHTDFPEQFTMGSTFETTRGSLVVAEMNEKRGTVRFVGHESIDSAKKLTNVKLFSNETQTRENCDLKEGQHFWFDIITCSLKENDEILGKVIEVQRMGDTDYLVIETTFSLVEAGFSKIFLLPYIEHFILSADMELKTIYSQNAKDILEAS
jgi:16S rRNA processing protein RimM